MGKTLFDLTYELARLLGIISEGIVTGGSITTLVDTVARAEADDYWNGGTAWVTYDAGGSGAAPQGEYGYISDFVQSTSTVTIRTALTAAIASGDRYALGRKRYPLELLIQKINEAFGTIEKTDITTVSIAAQTLEYTLPADLLDLKQVWIQVDPTVDNWQLLTDWSVQKSATGSPNKLILKRQFLEGYAVKLVYMGYHQTLRVATDKLDDSYHIDKIIYPAAVGCLLWRKARVGDADLSVNDLLNYYQQLTAEKVQEFKQDLPRKTAKTIHPIFPAR